MARHNLPHTEDWLRPEDSGYNRSVAKTKMGRPRRAAKVADELIALRLTKAERRKWEAAAKRAEMTLSDWIRHQCNSNAAVPG